MKNAIVVIDATPFRQWFEAHYALPLGHKKNAKLTEAEEALLNKKKSKRPRSKLFLRTNSFQVAFRLQFPPGPDSGRSDGYILERKELEFYLKKIKFKKGNKYR